jgi:hypothetical protein
VLAAAAVSAETEYDYPPEFADLFEQFRVITPGEAQLYVALDGDDPWHTFAGGVVLEPVLIKCVNGVPGYYLVLSYHGKDSNVRGEMENVINILNDDAGFDPTELDERISALEPYWGDFRYYGIPAWTYDGGPVYSRAYAPELLVDFPKYLASLREEANARDIPRLYIHASFTEVTPPMFALGVEGQDGYFIGDPETGCVRETKGTELAATFREQAESISNKVSEEPDGFTVKARRWDLLMDRKAEAEKKGEYLKVREYEA